MTKYAKLMQPVAEKYGLRLEESDEAKAAREEAIAKVRTFIEQLREARRSGVTLGLLKASYEAYMEKAERGAVKSLARLYGEDE